MRQTFWSLAVPAGQSILSFSISGGTGDADLYVAERDQADADFLQLPPVPERELRNLHVLESRRRDLVGHAERLCGVFRCRADWHILERTHWRRPGARQRRSGHRAFWSAGSKQFWRINTPAGKTLKVKISGGTGDADLYVRFGSRPTTSTYACRPYLIGNNETCTLSNTSAGDYYVMLRGYAAYSGVSVIASY